jgi:hypothetical protein
MCIWGTDVGSKWHEHAEGVVRGAGKPYNYLQEMWLIVNLGVQGLSRAVMSRQGHGCGVAEQVHSGYVLYTDTHCVFTLKPFESPVSL